MHYKKGYKDDAGYDILLDDVVCFKAKETTVVDLNRMIIPKRGTCAMLIARTSAARLGLIVAMCPIDANYNGNVHAIVYNSSDKDIIYYKDEAFCQVVFVKLAKTTLSKNSYMILKKGKRGNNKFGSTGK